MFYGTECTLNTDRICLPNGSDPGIQCSGIKFIGRNAFPMRKGRGFPQCTQLIWNLAGEPVWNETYEYWEENICLDDISIFHEERGLCLLDYIIFNPADPENPYLYDACEDHPIARTENITLVNCHNRFGGARKFKEITYTSPSFTYDSFYFYDYDESCVGYKTSNDGGVPLDEEWQDNPTTTYAIGIPQQSLELPEGPCTGNEPSVMYTIAADPSNCGGVTSCIEIITRECVADPSTVYGVDPYCPPDPPPPPTLFQDVLFCDVDADIAANLWHNAFCTTDPEFMRLDPVSTYFCEFNPDLLRIQIENVRFCNADEAILRGNLETVNFCNYEASIILPPPPPVVNINFCNTDVASLRIMPANVRFCEQGIIIQDIRFCEFESSVIRNLDTVQFCETVIPLAVTFCQTERKNIDGVPEVQFCEVSKTSIESNGLPIVDFCEQNIATGVFFCEQKGGLPGLVAGNVSFCEQDRRTLDNITDVAFCEYDRSVIDNVPNISFCEHDRSTIDNVTDVSFCEHDRKSIDNVDDITFCEISRTQIDGAGLVRFCSSKRSIFT